MRHSSGRRDPGQRDDVGGVPAAVGQQGGHVGLGLRLAEQEALAQHAAGTHQPLRLLGALDALGDGDETETGAHRQHAPHHRLHLLVPRQPVHEGLVHLELVERQPGQVVQRGVAGAEVVDGDVYAEASQGVQARDHPVHPDDDGGLGDLQHQPVGVDAGFVEGVQQFLDEVRLAELQGRQVHRHHEVALEGLHPHRGPARLQQHPAAQLDDHPGLLGQGHELVGGDETPFRVLPAHQGLDAVHAAGAQVHDRLVDEGELVVEDRLAQVLLEGELLDGALLQTGLVVLDPGPVGTLDAVHRDLGVAQHVLAGGTEVGHAHPHLHRP